ncbi:hypothetical protein M231_05945 [Tremella mesenterica]|uniref:Phosphoglycerate mutase n=1 Tax=Tremella mesenterica TaxID=5217 RepID=A0A4Q1BGS7_TREME|nr:hypothetical protein M231_05945 [Tremella mesenterica]
MPYQYQYLEGLFTYTTWDKDIKSRLGLDGRFANWAAFRQHIQGLKEQAELEGYTLKVIYAARHGQAEHNVIEANYIHREEDDIIYPPPLGPAHMRFPVLDPKLTSLGRSQANNLRLTLQEEVSRGFPIPEVWYVSPLRRAIETSGIEWGFLFDDKWEYRSDEDVSVVNHKVPIRAIENLREHLHAHQCDARLPTEELLHEYPNISFEGLQNIDPLWRSFEQREADGYRGGDIRETEDELVERLGKGIAEAIELSEDATYLSVTSHSGAMRGVYKSLGVPPRPLTVGEMNVLVMRVKQVDKEI